MTERWKFVWPIADETLTAADLFAAAREDLPGVAFRQARRVVSVLSVAIHEGRTVPGSGGAHLVVVVVAATVHVRDVVGDDVAELPAPAYLAAPTVSTAAVRLG